MSEQEWAVRLFQTSVMKQNKLRQITQLLGPTEGLSCLDIGSDNGVVSYLLRQRGGAWKSADLDPTAVIAIRKLVGSEVYLLDGGRTPFPDNTFDRIVIVDFLEHIPDDAGFIQEARRILKPDGTIIVNVPHKKGSLLRRFRYAIGQTDEKHGHLRPGYTVNELQALLGNGFWIDTYTTYSRFFSEVIDTLIVFTVSLLQGKDNKSSKGLMVTGQDLAKNRKLFRMYSLLYPVVWLFSQLDRLLFFTQGYMLIARAGVLSPERAHSNGHKKESTGHLMQH
jgi:SAM-dependent methyltransferase